MMILKQIEHLFELYTNSMDHAKIWHNFAGNLLKQTNPHLGRFEKVGICEKNRLLNQTIWLRL